MMVWFRKAEPPVEQAPQRLTVADVIAQLSVLPQDAEFFAENATGPNANFMTIDQHRVRRFLKPGEDGYVEGLNNEVFVDGEPLRLRLHMRYSSRL